MAKMPKRNKSKDNPYTLDFNENKDIYTVEFVDNKGVINKVEISVDVFQAFDRFELEDISQIHKFRKHIEHSELTENTLHNRMIDTNVNVEDIVENQIMVDELKLAIETLTDTQKKRIKMYYFEDLTLQKIANIEGCSIKNVHKSIEQAKEKLKEILKK